MSSRPPTESPVDLSAISFENPLSAQSAFFRLAPQISGTLVSTLPALLSDSPDPDGALALFERMVTSSSPETLRLIERNHALAHFAIVVFGHSQFLGETLIHNPDLLLTFLRDRTMSRSFAREDFAENLARFRSRTMETNLSLLLARFKRREYVRILLRDILQLAPLAEITAEISALSDTLIEAALSRASNQLHGRYGAPLDLDQSSFAVLSLGKLGGNELNYSSDVDLMYIFENPSEQPGAAVCGHEYFVRLAQSLTEILSRVTTEGPVFRTDLRLRPEGSQGELAISVAQALHYYESVAHDWELQALIKVRHSAGSATLARQFIRGVQPYVYTPNVNFAAIKTALVARERMIRRRHPTLGESDAGMDVKIGSGGIRDIEFLVQCLQRVYGGAEPWLRSSGTLFSLQKLHDKQHLASEEFDKLTSAYEFLRHLEHRLQLRQGRQLHTLPTALLDLHILQRSMRKFLADDPQASDFPAAVACKMAAVAEIYRRVIYQQRYEGEASETSDEFHLRSAPEPAVADHSNRQILNRLLRDAPALYEVASREDLSHTARKNLFRFLTAALTSSERYAFLLRHAELLPRAIPLLENSDYLTDTLVRHSEEIATLAGLSELRSRAGSGYLFESDLVHSRASDPVFDYLANSAAPYGEKLALLRRHFRHRVFATGAKDIADHRGVYTSLGEITAASEDAFAAAFQIAGAPEGLAVMALGRLGSGEFDVFSDADVLFVCDEDANREQLTQAASRIVQILSAYTQEGTVFPVDVRLRPRGVQGELLSSTSQLAAYFAQEAQAWEALTFSKLRFLVGSQSVAAGAFDAANSVFQRFASDARLVDHVRDMRIKLQGADAADMNFKTSAGAVYDIDFLCAFLLVRNHVADKRGTLRDRLWRCAELDLLKKTEAAQLDHATELFRTVDHVLRLVAGRPCKWLPASGHIKQAAEGLTSQILQRDFPDGLDAELEDSRHTVRQIYESALGKTIGADTEVQ